MKDNVYITFTYNNTSGVLENMIFDNITKRVPILDNPSDYEVGVTRAYLRVPSVFDGTLFPPSGQFSRVVIMSDSIGIAQEFSNNIQNDLQPIISSFQYGQTGISQVTYLGGYILFPGLYNGTKVKYTDIESSSPLYRLNLSVKAQLKDGSFVYFRSNEESCASVTLHFRKK